MSYRLSSRDNFPFSRIVTYWTEVQALKLLAAISTATCNVRSSKQPSQKRHSTKENEQNYGGDYRNVGKWINLFYINNKIKTTPGRGSRKKKKLSEKN